MKLHPIGAALVLLASSGAQAQVLITPATSALAAPRGIHSAPAPLALLPVPKLLPLPNRSTEARPTPFPAPTVLGTVVTAKPKLVEITGPQTQPPAPGVKPPADSLVVDKARVKPVLNLLVPTRVN
jgi:hypothetical protein